MQKAKANTAGKSPAGAKQPRKLSRAEKKQIAEVIRQAKGDGKAHTAQQTIPYLTMYPDGICRVSEKKYSKSVAFEDINYQLAQPDDKTAIFENWCDFLNYFDASVSVQLSFINQGTQRGEAEKAINIPAQDDAFNSIRTEYGDMLKNQLSKGNNGLVKHMLKNRRQAMPVIIDGYSRFLFLNRDGKPKVAANYDSMFRGLVKKYNKSHEEALPKVTTPHTLRHTFCTNLANAGMNPKALQYIMGHSNINMTLNYYAHATPDNAMAEMERLIA